MPSFLVSWCDPLSSVEIILFVAVWYHFFHFQVIWCLPLYFFSSFFTRKCILNCYFQHWESDSFSFWGKGSDPIFVYLKKQPTIKSFCHFLYPKEKHKNPKTQKTRKQPSKSYKNPLGISWKLTQNHVYIKPLNPSPKTLRLDSKSLLSDSVVLFIKPFNYNMLKQTSIRFVNLL